MLEKVLEVNCNFCAIFFVFGKKHFLDLIIFDIFFVYDVSAFNIFFKPVLT